MKYRKTSEELRELLGVESIKTVIRSGRLRWYGHVKWKNDWGRGECMEVRVEGKTR